MGLFFKLMMFLVVLALAAPFVMKGPDGRPLMTLDDIKMPDVKVPEVPDSVKNLSDKLPDIKNPLSDSQPSSAKANKVYSWTDANGNVQFSNTPPSGVTNVKATEYHPDANVIKLDKPSSQSEPHGKKGMQPKEGAQQKHKPQGDSALQDVSSLYSPEGVQKLMNDAKALEGKMQQRYQQYDQ